MIRRLIDFFRWRVRYFVAWYMDLQDLHLCYSCEQSMVGLKGQICRYCLFEEE